MAFIDEQNTYLSLTPNVYISRITLSSHGGVETNAETSDRVAVHTAPQHVFSAPGGFKLNEMLESLEGDAPVTGAPASQTNIEIDFVMKEKMTGLAEFWADKKDMQKYINHMWYLTAHPLTTKILSIGSNALIVSPAGSQSYGTIRASLAALVRDNLLTQEEKDAMVSMGVHPITFDKVKNLKRLLVISGSDVLGDDPKAALEENLKNFINSTVVFPLGVGQSIYDLMGNSKTYYGETIQPYTETDSSGVLIKNYKFTSGVSIVDSNLSHLAVSTFTYLNFEKMTEDFELDFGSVSSPRGKLTYDVIMDKGKISGTSFVYINPKDNSVWNGPVHFTQDQNNLTGIPGAVSGDTSPYTQAATADAGVAPTIKTGFVETSDSFEVIKKEVPNTKIQDFRVLDRVGRINFDLSFLESPTLSRSKLGNKFSRDNTDVFKQPAYFTDLYLARSPLAGRIKVCFRDKLLPTIG